MSMLRYLARRFFFLALLLVGVSLTVFLIIRLVPANPAVAYLGPQAAGNPAIVAAFEARWGLDKPLPTQYLLYLAGLLRGDLGVSIRTGQPVLRDLAACFPPTVELAAAGMLIATVLGVLFGVISATRPNTLIDQALRGISVSGVSVPSFWLGLVFLYVFYHLLHWLPGPGRISARLNFIGGPTNFMLLDALLAGNWAAFADAARHLILPGLVLGMFSMGLITRTTRSSLMEVMSMDFIRTARSKGLARPAIVGGHAMINAAVPVLTVIGMGFCNLLGGVILVEKIFNWPGVGQYAYLSATGLDFPAITGVALLIAAVYAGINLVIDVLYAVIDPRVRY
ncbi:MAG: ABC transporter permease [Peptococcaceae bacterium]|jgi:peptide/nickel transport system permease protein|nr:ABC transporter permease [Peptococcaceae bacterium]